jgi:hypothetical protein
MHEDARVPFNRRCEWLSEGLKVLVSPHVPDEKKERLIFYSALRVFESSEPERKKSLIDFFESNVRTLTPQEKEDFYKVLSKEFEKLHPDVKASLIKYSASNLDLNRRIVEFAKENPKEFGEKMGIELKKVDLNLGAVAQILGKDVELFAKTVELRPFAQGAQEHLYSWAREVDLAAFARGACKKKIKVTNVSTLIKRSRGWCNLHEFIEGAGEDGLKNFQLGSGGRIWALVDAAGWRYRWYLIKALNLRV